MIFLALKVLHVLLCVFLIVVVLLQHGKGQDIGAAFGGSSQTVFGPSGGGSFFGKLTAAVAVLFMLTSVSLGYFTSHRSVKTLVPESSAPAEAAGEAKPQPEGGQPAETGGEQGETAPTMPALPGGAASEKAAPAPKAAPPAPAAAPEAAPAEAPAQPAK